jgi:DNA-binding transcriptional LysR family regulator
MAELSAFSAVVEARSFTKAGQKLGLDKARVSRLVSALETRVGSTLFLRTTRMVRPTAEGEALALRVGGPLAELTRAVTGVSDRSLGPSGEVVLSTTSELARLLIAPHLLGFRLRYPGIHLTISTSETMVDLAAGQADLGVRVGKPGSKELVARKLTDLEAGFFASPAYLERRGTPGSASELAKHEGLWPPPQRGRSAFAGLGKGPPPKAAISSNDFSTLAELARAGAGVALLPTFVVEHEVARGSLVRILPTLPMPRAPLFLVSRSPKKAPQRVLALRDYLLKHLLLR